MQLSTISAALAALLFVSCGSAAAGRSQEQAYLAALLLPPPCTGVCYEFSDASGLTAGPGLTLGGGRLSGSGFFNINAAVTHSEPLVTVTFSLDPGGALHLSTGNPAAAGSGYFDNQADGNRFSIRNGSAGSARDKAGTTDTMTSSVAPQSSTMLTYCFSWHVHSASDPLHMVLWTNCASTTSSASAYNSSDAAKIVGGVTNIKNAAQPPVSGGLIGFELTNAAVDRVVVQAK